MPVEDGIGHGDFTALKIDHFSTIVEWHLKVTRAVLDKHSYFRQAYRYVDLTAGKGYAPGTTVPGSPIAFLERIHDIGFDKAFRMDLIEAKRRNITELRSCIEERAQSGDWEVRGIFYHQGKYQDVIRRLFPQQDTREFGLAFVDPSGNLPDFETLSYISRVRPKFDILIYVSTTNIKRVYPQTGKFLEDYMQEVGKEYWLIRRPTPDSHRWTFLLGSATDIFKKYGRIGFLRLDSEEAEALFPKLNLTEKQRMEKNQLRLPFD